MGLNRTQLAVGVTAAGASLAAAAVAAKWFRRGTNWGAAAAEREKPLPGDAIVPRPVYRCTRAITIDAEPRYVWPWLVQMGNGRGGLYSYDWLDRLFGFLDAPSAKEILPDHRELHAGDTIPIGRGGDFPVHLIDPERAVVLSGDAGDVRWLWAFVLEPLPDGRTRLYSRNRVSMPHRVGTRLATAVIDMAATIMTRRMLLNLRERAERLKAGDTATDRAGDVR